MDLYNNPMVDAARSAMTPEQIENYKQMGEYMYSDLIVDTVTNTKSKGRLKGKARKASQTKSNVDTEVGPIKDAIQYILIALRSGLHPSQLSDDEKDIMKNKFGDRWFALFGYENLEF